MTTISVDELAAHGSEKSAWIAIHGQVYDVTQFIHEHPGGKKILLRECGKESSAKFDMFHDPDVLRQHVQNNKMGVLVDSKADKKKFILPKGMFGDLVPFGDPIWYQGHHSPYYNDSHRLWRVRIRDFTEKEIMPFVSEWEENYKMPADIYTKAGKAGLMAAVLGRWPTEYVGEGPENFDMFHLLIALDELTRCGAGGVPWGLSGGLMIGLPPIINFGSKFLKDKVARACLLGEKIICLCISEPWAASDVAGLQTIAEKKEGYYLVNGCKKWITNGIYADYFTVACRTGPAGSRGGGLSLLLLEKGMPGLSVRHMKCQGVWSSGTAYIEFEDVKVPHENLIGIENQGFMHIMYNFNHERWGLVVQANRLARVCLEEAFKYSMKRKTFNKSLIQHQAIRMKLADMARMVESMHAWTEAVTYQWCKMGHKEAMVKLGDTIALLKVQSTKVLELCAREAVHTFGGAGYVRGGVGEKVERIYRDVRAFAIPGGAEEILGDFAIRSAAKTASKISKL